MKYERFIIKLMDIIPQQHYLSKTKLNKVIKSFEEYDSYGDIYVMSYDGSIFSIDGHHRLFYLYNIGIEEIEVVNEFEDNNNKLYQILADEARELGITTIADLKNRIIESEEEYKIEWIDKCQEILKELNK